MENNNKVCGFKVFNPDWTCQGVQYEVGKTYEINESSVCCSRGVHFCLKAADCFNYYSFNSENKVAEVEALGEVVSDNDDIKRYTNKIKIVREVPWNEVLEIVNTGNRNTGNRNTGDWNTGNRNTGNRNTGDWNTGYRNTGDRNTGDWNTGNRNTGDWNTGNRNTGDWNTGNGNTGDWNTGYRNTGDWNTGYRNTGDWNTGNGNTGDWNTGNGNTGNRNTGNRNTGDRNTGDWNKSSFNTGCFMTEEQKIFMFNKPSDWTYRDWVLSEARCLLNQIPNNAIEWVDSGEMTAEEKAGHPTHETTGGYLKEIDDSECSQLWWERLSDDQKSIIKKIPNFDSEIFRQCTGIDVNMKKEE